MPSSKRGKFLDESVAKSVALQLGKKYPDKSQFIAPSVISEMLGVSSEAVKQWIYSRRLPAVKLTNGYWKIRVSDLESYLKTKYDIQRRVLIFSNVVASKDLPSEGIFTVFASNYTDAIVKVMDTQPSLLIADGANPDTWKLVKKIRDTKMTLHLPVVLISKGQFSDIEVDKALAMRIQSVVEIGKLSAEIERIFG